MPRFSKKSVDKLHTCDSRIQDVMYRVIQHIDFTVLEGHRSNERQEEMFAEGRSKLRAGQSKHNKLPSLAIDIAPWPIDWNDEARFAWLAGQVVATAREMGIKLRWGGDWDRDGELSDNRFNDLPHFELDE